MKREQIIGLGVLLALTSGAILVDPGHQAAEADGLSDGERVYQEMLEAAPLAEVEGEAVSPDGRFEVRAAGETDLYVSGVRVPEKAQVVDRSTEEVLWETEGMVAQRALWSPEGGFLALALSARTWCDVTVIETEHWTSWDFTLPDGSPIPEYTFPAEHQLQPWGEWRTENCLDLTFEGNNEDVSRYTCCLSMEQERLTGETLERTLETLPGTYDFNHDGQTESVDITSIGDVYTLRVIDADGSTLWKEEAYGSHAGWTSIFACSIEGQEYLIRYLPTMAQGFATYTYQLFSLSGVGEEEVLREGSAEFDINFGSTMHEKFDPVGIAAFLEEIHGLLEDSELLLTTEGGDFRSGGPGAEFKDDLAYWTDDPLYDDGKSLEENIRAIGTYWEDMMTA